MRILIVEDEETLANRIAEVLKKERYEITVAFDGANGLDQALTEPFDLIILDILLPKLDGISVLRELRADGIKTPVLLLTAKDDIEDKVRGLDSGADDYLTKPFAIAELLARIRSLLRRQSDAKSAELVTGDVCVNTHTREVRCSDELVNLTPKEYAILEFLLYNKNRVVSRLSIAEHVWGDSLDSFSMTNFVDVHVKNLRKKITSDNGTGIIETVRGLGYLIRDKE